MVKMQVDPKDQAAVQDVQTIWASIHPDSITKDYDLDYQVSIDFTSLSPTNNEDEKKKLFEFLAVISQYPQVSTEPDLIREIAYRIGYRNERIISKMANAAQLMLVQQAEGMGKSEKGQAQTAASTPPLMEAVRNSIVNQNTKGVV
jgi:hypothetical protein